MTLSRCETAIAFSARNNVQKKEKHGGFLSVRCLHKHTHIWRVTVSRSQLFTSTGVRTQSMCYHFSFRIYSIWFFYSSDEFNSADQAHTHTHTNTIAHGTEKTMFTESFLSFNFNVCCHFDSKSNGSFSFSEEEQNRNLSLRISVRCCVDSRITTCSTLI